MNEQAQFGMVGMAVMGRNLSLNILDNGVTLAGYNREADMLDDAVKASDGRIIPCRDYPSFIAALQRPRRIMLMIKAGKPVDMVLDALLPLLEPGDIVIDGGNSNYRDTARRQQTAEAAGVHFLGVGVSGGAKGARRGPSLMPGGQQEAYEQVRPVFEAISAKTDSGAAVTYVSAGGAGHFVKMVHNGIEYADMQFIAEAYDLLKRVVGLAPAEIATVFEAFNEGPLGSFLIEITAKIMRHTTDTGHTVESVLDKAGQKGTGRWTAQIALELGVPVPSIAAAIDARVLSSMKAQRVAAEPVLQGPAVGSAEREHWVRMLGGALLSAKICAYAQGLALIAEGSKQNNWGVDLCETARIWKGGCIIRARLLDTIMRAYKNDPELSNLLMAAEVRETMNEHQLQLRELVAGAVSHGVAVPGMSASLAYYDSFRTARLPQNLVQAQRDAFGSHTYQTVTDPTGAFVHTNWLGEE